MVTEYGTTDYTGDGAVDIEETNLWWNFMDANQISYCNWSVCDKEEGSAALIPGTLPEALHIEAQLTPSGAFVKARLLSGSPSAIH